MLPSARLASSPTEGLPYIVTIALLGRIALGADIGRYVLVVKLPWGETPARGYLALQGCRSTYGLEPDLRQPGRQCSQLVRRNSKLPMSGLWFTFRSGRLNVASNLIGKLATARQPSTEGFDEAIVALASFALCGHESRVRQSRRAGQPKTHEHGQRLIRDRDVPLDQLHLPRHAIELTRQRRFQSIGAVR